MEVPDSRQVLLGGSVGVALVVLETGSITLDFVYQGLVMDRELLLSQM